MASVSSPLLGAVAPCVLAIVLLAPAPAHADPLTLTHTFSTSNQSMWGSGVGFGFGSSKFFGVTWNTHGGVDALGCGILGCYGADFDAYSSGKIGVDVGVALNGGALNLSIPIDLTLNVPDRVDRYQGTFSAFSSSNFQTGLLTTQSPSVSAYADLVLNIKAGATAQLCFVSCSEFGGDLVNINSTSELAALNRNNDGALRVLGLGFDIPTSGSIGGSLDYSVTQPDVQLSVAQRGRPPFHPFADLHWTGTSDFIHLDANLVNVATTALGLPALSGSNGTIDYNLLSAGLGLDVGVAQAFAFQPVVGVRLDVLETGESTFFPTFPDLGSFSSNSLRVPTDSSGFLHVTPTFTVQGLFANTTSFVLEPNLFAKGGEFGVSGIGSIGPLFDKEYPLGTFPIEVFGDSFNLQGFDSFTGPTFVVEIVPEPGSLLLFATGLAWLAIAASRRGRCR